MAVQSKALISNSIWQVTCQKWLARGRSREVGARYYWINP